MEVRYCNLKLWRNFQTTNLPNFRSLWSTKCSIMIVPIILALFVIGATLILWYKKWLDTYWERRGCFQYHPKSKNENILLETYKALKAKGMKYGGFVTFYRPSMMIADFDVVKSVLIKDFDHFSNRGFYADVKRDPFSASLNTLENQQWKDVRSIVSPIFSSGKMKMILPDLVAHANIMVKVLEKGAEKGAAVEVKDIVKKFGIDALGSIVFGIEINTLEGNNQEFLNYTKNITAMNWKRIAEHVVDKRILRFLRVRISDPAMQNFIIETINTSLEYRKKNNITRNDIFGYMQQKTDYEIKDGQLTKNGKLSKIQMMINLRTFFGGGFETSSSAASFALFELSRNQDIQDRLRQNIRDCLKKHEKLTYEAIMDMEYLDWTVCETLRKYPSSPALNRICTKPYNIPNTDVWIKPGEYISVPVQGFQMDPDFYPEPEQFIPERFSPENKAKRHPMTFLPFGDGPRNCLAFRLGFLITKVAVASIIGNFRVTLNKKTIVPLRIKKALLLDVEGGVWVDFVKVD